MSGRIYAQFIGVDLNTLGSNLAIMGRNCKHEDLRSRRFIQADHGEGRWPAPPENGVLKRCGKSYRLCWVDISVTIKFHKLLGNRWSLNEDRIRGSTDDEIKNYVNTRLCKKADANACIGILKSVRPTERDMAVSMTLTLNPNQLGDTDEVTQPVG